MIVQGLRKLRLITRLSLTAMLALLVMSAIIYEAVESLHSVLYEDREMKTRHLVEVATGTVSHFHSLQRSGALSEEDARQQAIDALKRLRYEGTEYFWIHDLGRPVPRMVMHPTVPALDGKLLDDPRFNKATTLRDGTEGTIVEVEGKNLFVAFNEVVERAGHGFVTYLWPQPKTGGGVTDELFPKLSYVKKFEPWGWVIGSGIYIDDVRATFTTHAYHLAILALAGTVLLVGAALIIRRSILVEFGGEPGDAVRITERIAEGDLTGRIALKPNDRSSVLYVLDRMQSNLRSIIRDMLQNARTVETNIERLSSESNEINLATQLQANAVDQTRSAIDEVSSSVEVITGLARDTEDSSGDVARCAQKGAAAAEEVAAEMRAIAETVATSSNEVTRLVERTREIDRMAAVIREIAEQTNLLALNAAIEAARAGEQGRGFAVVADEVRKLAERTGQATAEITSVLHGIQADTGRAVAGMNAAAPVIATGVDKANQTASALRAIEQQSQATLQKMSALARATRAQTERIGEIVGSINEVLEASARTETVIQHSQETATALEAAANELFRMVQRFELGEAAGEVGPGAGSRKPAKALLEWSERLSVGHRDIDRQHQRLIEIANRLNAAMHAGHGREVAGSILKELVDYTVGHFEFEEQLMARHGYRDQDRHVAEHRKLIEEVGAFKRSFEKGNASISIELMAFIRDWLLNHILKADKALARELAGATRAKAAR